MGLSKFFFGKHEIINYMNSKQLYLRLFKYVYPYLKGFIFAIVAIVLFALTEPILPALMQPLLDGSFVDDTEQPIWFIPIFISVLFIIRGILFFVSKYLMAWVSQGVVRDLRNELMEKITKLPSDFFNHNPAGKLISKVTYNVLQVAETTTEVLIILIRDSLTILSLLAFLVYTSWQLSMFIFMVFPAVTWLVKKISLRLRMLSHSTQDNMGQITHILEEAINGQKITKVFAGKKYETNRFFAISDALRKFFIKSASTNAASISFIQFFNATAVACVIYFSLSQAHSGQLSVGEFVSFLGGLAMMWPATKRLTQVNEKLQRGLAAADSVFALADEIEERETGTEKLLVKEGSIVFTDIDFKYQSSERMVLKKLNLNIKSKQIIALVGDSGSGKSSLVQLLLRLYDPNSGSIKIDNTDLKDCTLASVRKNISYVDQNTILFNDTVANNIAYGHVSKKHKKEIIEAAKLAYAYDFVQELPDGFNSLIGSGGALLSGGQRQRIAIARALFKQAPLLIMDEATSALDQKLEKLVFNSISTLRSQRTVILITHRLSAIVNVDQIFLFADGKISDSGNHQQLMSQSDAYRQLYLASEQEVD